MSRRFLPWVLLASVVVIPSAASAAEYHIDPAVGDDANPGTSDSPWRTLGVHADNRNNEVRLQAGDVLTLHEGVYCEFEVQLRDLTGTADQPIIIRAADDEYVEFTGDIMRCGEAPLQWEPVSDDDCVALLEEHCVNTPPDQRDSACADIAIDGSVCEGLPIYRTATRLTDDPFYATVFPASASVRGYGRRDGDWEQLITYTRVADFVAPDLVGGADPHFLGPGILTFDGYAFARLDVPGEDVVGIPVAPYDSLDPNDVDIELAMRSPGASAVLRISFSQYVEISGLQFRTIAGAPIVGRDGPGNEIGNFVLRDLTFDSPGGGIFFDGVHGIEVLGSSFTQRTPRWLAWGDTKSDRGAALSATNPVLTINFDSSDILVSGNRFEDVFDAINMLGEQPIRCPRDIEISDNVFIGVRDDSINLTWGNRFVEVANNEFWGVSKAVSRQGGDYPGEFPEDAHSVDIHHNRMDTSIPMAQARARDDGSPPRTICHSTFGSHNVSGSNMGPGPWRVYHNTIIGCTTAADLNNGGGVGLGYVGLESELTPQLAYNNVIEFVEDSLVLRSTRAHGAAYYDGNVYWRRTDDPQGAFFFPVLYAPGLDPSQDVFNSLQEARADALFVERTRHDDYAPQGWEAMGVEDDPRLGFGDCPALDGPAATTRVDLGAFDLPGVDGSETYVGAVDPASPLCEVMRELLIESVTAPADDDCPQGAITFSLGLDDGDAQGTGEGEAGDGTLQDVEVDGTFRYCRSEEGEVLLIPTALAEECDGTGVLFRVGVDGGRRWGTHDDGRLGPGEVTATDSVCFGPSTPGEATGESGESSSAGSDGQTDGAPGVSTSDGPDANDDEGGGPGPGAGCGCTTPDPHRTGGLGWLVLCLGLAWRKRRDA